MARLFAALFAALYAPVSASIAVAAAASGPIVPAGTPVARATDSRPGIPAGRVEEHRIESRTYGSPRRVFVYTPPAYDPAAPPCGILIAFDGEEYLSDVPLPAILDALLADRRAPPFVAVLIDSASGAARLGDLANHRRFADFVGEEVVPWARRNWNVARDPKRTIAAGSSAGGLAAAYVAFQRPDLFGNALSLSGAFWRGNEGSNDPPFEWLTDRFDSSPKKEIRFFLEVGSLESKGAMGGQAPSILDANRRLRDVLKKKGYAVTYTEVPGGVHAPETWKTRLPAGIAALSRPRG